MSVLITGGSSGIGLELARLFMKDHADVVLVASKADKLESAAERLEREFARRPLCIQKDLAYADSPREIFETLRTRAVSVDTLVNNAGFGLYGKFERLELADQLRMMDVNMKSLVALTRLFLPAMLEKREGSVLNVASTAAFQAIAREAVYAASKAFVLSFSEALSEELRGTGVQVTCLCPGPTNTPDFWGYKMTASPVIQANMMDAERVAEIGYRALRRGRMLAIAGFKNRFLMVLERFIPRKWATRITARVVQTREPQ